jgi:hypothetical protein
MVCLYNFMCIYVWELGASYGRICVTPACRSAQCFVCIKKVENDISCTLMCVCVYIYIYAYIHTRINTCIRAISKPVQQGESDRQISTYTNREMHIVEFPNLYIKMSRIHIHR